MVLTTDDIKRRIQPIAKQYGLAAVYLFGSYARGEATDASDIDLLIDRSGSKVKSLFDMGGLSQDFSESVAKKVDLITVQALQQSDDDPRFEKNLQREMRLLYEK
jgi:predicted nucleotidyltransferase